MKGEGRRKGEQEWGSEVDDDGKLEGVLKGERGRGRRQRR